MKKFAIITIVIILSLIFSYNCFEKQIYQYTHTVNNKYDSILRPYKNQRIIFIDYSLPSDKKRLWILEGDSVLLCCRVSHGKNSGLLYATEFSNVHKSNKSCIGKFKTMNSYQGKHGLSMRVKGLESTNNNAYSRSIVFHSADYAEFDFLIKHGYLGRSFGCFATAANDNEKIIKLATEKKSIPVIVVN